MIYFICTFIFNLFTKDQWITIIFTLIGIFGSVLIAYWIFNSEQKVREKEEIEFNNNHFKYFELILESYSKCIVSQILYINEYLTSNSFHLSIKLVSNFPTHLFSKVDTVNLIKFINKKNHNIEKFLKLLISINLVDNVMSSLKEEYKTYYNQISVLEDKYKKTQNELIFYHNFELLNLVESDTELKEKYHEIVFEYNALILKARMNQEIFPNDGTSPINRDLLYQAVFKPSFDLFQFIRTEHNLFLLISNKLNDISNDLNDIKNITSNHKKNVENLKGILNSSLISIDEFLF